LPLGAGAGSGKESPAPEFVGRNVPPTSGPASGIDAVDWSSSVKVTPLASVVPPTSDMTIALWPVGPTSRRSRSSASVWVMFLSSRLTSVMLVPKPATSIVDGYGVAGPSGIRIAPGLTQGLDEHGGGGGGGVPVSMLSDQPPVISPQSAARSSAT
jgi:hypothetical protein